MKKLLLTMLALCMVISVVLVACEDPEQPVVDSSDVTTEAPSEKPTETEPPVGTTDTEPDTGTTDTESDTTPDTTPDTSDTTPDTEPVVDPDPVTTHISFDQFCTVLDGTETDVFAPGASAGWDKTANIEDYKVQYIKIWGWAAFYGEAIGEYGYQINDEEPVYSADFVVEAGADVVAAAGGKPVSRFAIMVPVRDLSGEFTVKGLVRDAVGTVEEICVATVTKAVDPDAPVILLDAAAVQATASGAAAGNHANQVGSAVLADDGSYVTLTSAESGGDPWILFRNVNVNAQFIAVKYRTTVANKQFHYFVSSTGNDATGAGDMSDVHSYEADGNWHVDIIDISGIEKVDDACLLSFLRYDFYTDGTNEAIDVAWIGAFNTAEAAQAYFEKTMVIADTSNTFKSDVDSNEANTPLSNADISNIMILRAGTNGWKVVEIDGAKYYELTGIDAITADMDGAYYLKANIKDAINGSGIGFVVRGYNGTVSSDDNVPYKLTNFYETDDAGFCGGSGIYAYVNNGKLSIVVKYYDAAKGTRVGNKIYNLACEGNELVMADNGYTVSIMVNGVTYATIDLSGSVAYEDITTTPAGGVFATKAVVTLKDGTTETIENTLVAATVNSQVGLTCRASQLRFSAIEVGGYTAIEVPALEIVEPEPVDPNAPIAEGNAEYLAGAAGTGASQTTATLSEDGKYVTLTSGEGDPIDPNFWVLPGGSAISGVQVIGLKYRTTVANGGEFFVGSTNITGGADEVKFDYIADGEWHVIFVDLTAHAAVVDGLVNYIRYDYFMNAAVGSTIDVESVVLFSSMKAAYAYYGIEVEEPEVPANYNVPTSAWTVTGHCTGIVGKEGHGNSGMVAAGGVEEGALLHQGYVGVGEVDLSKYSKAIVYYGIDGSPVTVGLYEAAANNRIILTSADQSMTNSPTEEVVLAASTYSELGWAVHALEIDLTGVDYNGPVFVTYDTLPGTFMLISSIEFVA